MIKKNIPYSRQYIDNQDIAEVSKILKSDWLTQGPKIQEFEISLAKYTGSKFAVIFNSGTAALHAAYFSVGLTKENEFITSPITFVATANAGLYLKAKPVFVDVEFNTGNIDIDKIEQYITKNTKLLVPVHYGGQPVNLEQVSKIAKKYNLFIIEDACHALGAIYKGEKIGNCKYSDMTVFSFHPVKHITTGEGGAVTTNKSEIYEKLIMFRNHGITKNKSLLINKDQGDWYYEMQLLGHNYRMTDFQAALGISQLKKMNEFVKRRQDIAKIYEEKFKNNMYFDMPLKKFDSNSSYHLYSIRLKDKYKNKKKDIFSKMRERGLGVQVHYIPVYLQPYYQNMGFNKRICPIAEDFYQKEISIPLYSSMKKKEIEYVTKTIFEILGDYK